MPHTRRSPRTESLRSPPIQIPLATIVLSAKPKGIRCTFVLSSNHSLTTKRSPYSKPTIFARTASPVGTSSGSANQYTSARYATLLHIDQQNLTPPAGSQTATPVSSTPVSSTSVTSNAGMKLKSNALLMTCRVCHRSRWLISGSQSAAGQCFICVIRIRATGSKSFFASLQSTRSSIWHWWCVAKGPYPVNFQLRNLSGRTQ